MFKCKLQRLIDKTKLKEHFVLTIFEDAGTKILQNRQELFL
jgi:hypothetical protein